MKARVKTRIIINAKPAAVFTYLSHTKYHHLWNPHLHSISPLAPLKLGDVYEAGSVVLGVRTKSVNHVTAFVQDREMQVENRTGMIQYCANYSLIEVEQGTKLVCTTTVSAEGKAFAFAKPMMEHLARRELNIDLKALKTAVETRQK